MESISMIGRDLELNQIKEKIVYAAKGHGTIICVEGDAGFGKTTLLKKLEKSILKDFEIKEITIAYGYCYDETGSHSAFQPFIEFLENLSKPKNGKKGWASLFTNILKETAPEWLSTIPVAGAFLGAGAKTANIITKYLSDEKFLEQTFDNKISQFINAIKKISRKKSLLILILEDAHWIDQASCELLSRMSREITDSNLVIILSYRTEGINLNQSLKNLLLQINSKENFHKISLSSFSEPEIKEYINIRFNTPLNPLLPNWLLHLCNGSPLFVVQYLNLLEQDKVIFRNGENYYLDGNIELINGEWILNGKIAEKAAPQNITELLEQRIQRLLQEEKEMLQIGSVQGESFDSLILAEVSNKDEIETLAKLRQISERHRIISLYTKKDLTTDKSDIYAFEHYLMYKAFYQKLTPRERLLYHQKIAQTLQKLYDESKSPSRKLAIDIAFHNKNGKNFLEAAQYYYIAAQSSVADGAILETNHLCKEAIDNLRLISDKSEKNQLLFAEVVFLYIKSGIFVAHTPKWHSFLSLANEGEAAAERGNDLKLLSQIKSLKGDLYIGLGNVTKALEIQKESVEVAKKTGDWTSEFLALVGLGSQLAKENLDESMNVRYEALKLYQDNIQSSRLSSQQLNSIESAYSKLFVYIGVGELDSGNFSKAQDYLNKGISLSKKSRIYGDVVAGLNYLGQTLIAMGQFEEAEKIIKEALQIKFEEHLGKSYAWKGYNLALLGKLYIEWGRIDLATQPLLEGMRLSELSQQADLLTLVRNYYAELLIHPSNENKNVALAEKTLIENLEFSQVSALYRSAVTSLSLLGLVKIQQNELSEAISYSTQAIEYINKMGNMPAVRTEEIFINHSQVLLAIGLDEESKLYTTKSFEIIMSKTKSIRSSDDRDRFLKRVSVNQNILRLHSENDSLLPST